jgi:hypothetical protein
VLRVALCVARCALFLFRGFGLKIKLKLTSRSFIKYQEALVMFNIFLIFNKTPFVFMDFFLGGGSCPLAPEKRPETQEKVCDGKEERGRGSGSGLVPRTLIRYIIYDIRRGQWTFECPSSIEHTKCFGLWPLATANRQPGITVFMDSVLPPQLP